MCLRYSSSVVAPMHWSSPRASAGLRMFAASTAPSAAPAPTSMCSSSMNRIAVVRVAHLLDDLLQALLELTAILRARDERADVERQQALARAAVSGTSPATIRWASPSTIAVLPTPGSPISTGLFFVRRDRIWMTRSISVLAPDDRVELAGPGGGGEVDRRAGRPWASCWRASSPAWGRPAAALRQDARGLARAPAPG